jgi:hypothetical protein
MQRVPFGGGLRSRFARYLKAADFGPALTPELKEREQRLRAQVEMHTLQAGEVQEGQFY